MAQNGGSNMTLNDDGRVLYQTGKEIRITKRTVSFGSNVYQFKNITGFSDGKIKRRLLIPCWWLVVGFIIGFICINSNVHVGYFHFGKQYVLYGTKEIGICIIVLAILGMIIDFTQEKKYGLILTLNSGDRHLFVTSDQDRMFGVIRQLHAFMESDQDGAYVVTINDNSIKIENMTGVVASRTKNTTISSNASHSGDKA